MIPTERYGVHQSHCCVHHGCKYGNEDCPVVSGEIVQEYACEDCPRYFKPQFSHIVNVNAETFTPIEEGKQTYFIFETHDYVVEKGHTMVFKSGDKTVARIVSQVDSPITIRDGYSIASFDDPTHNIESNWY